ncbi:MAG: hypothetical protein H0X28_01265 [Solirubrobacterales bacterium]|nr:hypothetical protein [Solirubrobacterales bacterium]
MAVDSGGHAYFNPSPAVSGWSSTDVDGSTALTAVSCPSSSLCVASDAAGNVLTSTSPASGAWTVVSIDPGRRLTGVSCSSTSLCVAVDDGGFVLASSDPTRGASAWHELRVDPGALLAVSCSASSGCVALDSAGNALASRNPVAPAPTWSLTPIDTGQLTAVSCASSGLCVAVDERGAAFASSDPASSVPAWSESRADPQALAGVSCLGGGLCVALDGAGRSVAGRVPAPHVTSLAPAEVTDTTATLSGVVDPNSALLGACTFEYGTSASYSNMLPCSLLPAPLGGPQAVSAQLAGLQPNTSYHYRLIATSPVGRGTGADEVFTTAVSGQLALVSPRPSIAGTPAVGQTLRCQPGVSAEAVAQLSYAWLRDLIPIAAASTSGYTVKGQDSGHHLQCQVTATDGAGSVTNRSGFVTIPVGGVPVSASETTVGRARYRNHRLELVLGCSPQASSGCHVSVRLSAVEMLSGRRVVAVAGRAAARHLDGRVAALRRRTVVLAHLDLRLAQGAHTTLRIALGAQARRLLSHVGSFSATLNVSGTVIGSLQAPLSSQQVRLGATARRAANLGLSRVR